MELPIQLDSQAKLSEHFTLGEMTKSGNHPEVYNIPSHEAIANLKRLCGWLEVLRERYNKRYCLSSRLSEAHGLSSRPNAVSGEISVDPSTTLGMTNDNTQGRDDNTHPIIINSGYRSPQLNRKVGGVPTSNHLTGCAVDIRVYGKEQLLRYATILLDYADETNQVFDELLIEKGSHGKIWLHFAVRPTGNRRKIDFLSV